MIILFRVSFEELYDAPFTPPKLVPFGVFGFNVSEILAKLCMNTSLSFALRENISLLI